MLFLGPDTFADGDDQERPFPLSLYIGHGDTSVCSQSSQSGTICPTIQNRSVSGYEWYGGVCVSQSFFELLMAKGKPAGMVMFEQDFICQTQGSTSLNLTLGRDWFRALDAAVLATDGVDLQLCMMQPAQALATTTMRSVTNARATQDHTDRSVAEGLPLGWSSLSLAALGLWPSRDNVWTNSSVDASAGHGEDKFLMREQMPVLQTAMAVLSGGPFGVADIAGTMNRSLAMRSCRSDGVLLRPSWPATAVDASFVHSFRTLKPLYLWVARSVIGSSSYSYILSINLDAPLTLPVAELCGGDGAGTGPADSDALVAVYDGWHGIERGHVRRMRSSELFTVSASPERTSYIAVRGPALRGVHTKHSQKAGPFSVARLKMDLPFHNRLAFTGEVPALSLRCGSTAIS